MARPIKPKSPLRITADELDLRNMGNIIYFEFEDERIMGTLNAVYKSPDGVTIRIEGDDTEYDLDYDQVVEMNISSTTTAMFNLATAMKDFPHMVARNFDLSAVAA